MLGKFPGALPDWRRVNAATASGRPEPRSISTDPSPIAAGLAVLMIAFRIATADTFGNACRKTAAIPATTGALTDVPLARLISAGHTASNGLLQYPWPTFPCP